MRLAAMAVLTAVLCTVAGQAKATDAGTGEPAVATHVGTLGIRGGVVVLVGLVPEMGPKQAGEVAIRIGSGKPFVVHGLDANAANVAAARKLAAERGVGGAVSFAQLRGKRLPFADNTVNRLIAEDLGGISKEEVMRVLVPRGIALVRDDVRAPGGPAPAESWRMFDKPWPAGMDEWTHWLYGPDNNAVGKDELVGPPRRIQWTAGPLWSRHHNLMPSVSVLVSAGGRVFYIVDEAPTAMTGNSPDKWFLVARDAFNGVELWRKPIKDWGWKSWSYRWEGRFNQPNEITKRLVAVGDKVYATLGYNAPLVQLDAATGEVERTFEGCELTDEIVYLEGKLIVSLNQEPQRAGRTKKDPKTGRAVFVGLDEDPPVHKSIAVIDANSGEMLWNKGDFVGNSTKSGPMERVTHLLLAARDKRIFLLDRDAVVGLDMETGKQLWRSPRRKSPRYTSRYEHLMSDMCTLVAGDGVVLLTQFEPIQKRIGWRTIKAGLRAFDAETGKRLWDYKCGSWAHFTVPDTFIAGGLAWVHDANEMEIVGLDPRTGAEKRRLSTARAFDNGHHHRCYRNKATEKYLVTSYRGYELIDWKTGEIDLNHWVRGTCRLGAMPCNGLLYTTAHPCNCYVASLLRGMLALAPEGAAVPEAANDRRLVRGSAYEAVATSSAKPAASKSTDWPTYRGDAARSGHARAAIAAPAGLKRLWETRLAKVRLTAPTVAGGVAVAASADGCSVFGVDAKTGEKRWTYHPGGQVDTPPTLHDGLAIFGCRDGWVYCLRASDGELAWRFLAAPAERLIGAFGRLESAWPACGSVVIHKGSVCVAAGRSSFLDGGIAAWRLDPRTGKILQRKRIASEQNVKVDTGRNVHDDYGVSADLLVADANGVYMRNYTVFGGQGGGPAWRGRLAATGSLIDDSWFNRVFWLLDGKVQGDSLVHDDTRVYSVRAYDDRGHGGFIEAGKQGYSLVATNRKHPLPETKGKRRLVQMSWPNTAGDEWTRNVPLRVRAMALAGDTLLCAGTPDDLDKGEPWAVYEGRRGGKLMAVSTAEGKTLTELDLPGAPVQDGIAVAGGRVYVTTADGRVICFGSE